MPRGIHQSRQANGRWVLAAHRGPPKAVGFNFSCDMGTAQLADPVPHGRGLAGSDRTGPGEASGNRSYAPRESDGTRDDVGG
jgi:hypothetical protein